MNFLLLFGPPAVGKMTVGMELCRVTRFELLHNHMTIDLARRFFDWGDPSFRRLVNDFRDSIVREALASDSFDLVFTYVWALDDPGDKAVIDRYLAMVAAAGGAAHFVELAAPLSARLERNATPLRLMEKWTKRDVEASEANLRDSETRYRMNSTPERPFFYDEPERYLRIENGEMSPVDCAARIKAHFDYPDAEDAP